MSNGAFAKFALRLRIPSRDEGIVPLRLWGPQRYLYSQFQQGLADGIRHFLILKGARQIGGSTMLLAWDLWWLLTHPGLQGMLVADVDDNEQYFRSIFRRMLASLPPASRWQTTEDNQGQLLFSNESRMMFATAGMRDAGLLGRSRGVNLLHADECGSYVDQEGLYSLYASLSERHPSRFYSLVSTARSYNLWHKIWTEAAQATTQRRVFLGWWLHHLHRIERDDALRWPRYGPPSPTSEEAAKIAAVDRLYHVPIAPEQLAWWRWKRAELIQDDQLIQQEYGWTEEECFVAFGGQVVSGAALMAMREIAPGPWTGHDYAWGRMIDGSSLGDSLRPHPDLTIWEEPVAGGVYLVAVQPLGASIVSRVHCVQVYRCWPDAVVQVAEYISERAATHQAAWVAAHLAGAYKATELMIEIGGPGLTVLQELRRMEDYGWGVSLQARAGAVRDLLGSVQHYLYRRADSWRPPSALQWKTTSQNHDYLMNQMADLAERGILEPRSRALIDELAALRRDEDGITPGGASGDDRAMCCAIACEAYLQAVLPGLDQRLAPRASGGEPETVAQATVAEFMRNLGRT